MPLSDLFRPKWKHSDPLVRAAAVWKLTDQRVLAELAKHDSARGVRCAAVLNLSDRSLLINMARNDSDREVRETATKRLGAVLDGVNDRATVEDLLWLLSEGDSYTRCRAVQSLGRIGDTRAVSPLIAALQDKDKHLRTFAAEALGKIGDQRAVEPLIELFRRSGDSEEEGQVAGALGLLGMTRLDLEGKLPEPGRNSKLAGKFCRNCAKLIRRISYTAPPYGVCTDCHETIHAKVATHRGPWCHNCGSLYHSNDELPRQKASYDDQLLTTYCPKCGSEKVY